jgi:hypothetical protein
MMIAATDQQIGVLVYELYGLIERGIRFVGVLNPTRASS